MKTQRNTLTTHFPDCEIFMMPQRSGEWHEIRKNKLTASAAGAWLAARQECRLTIPEIKVMLNEVGVKYNPSDTRGMLLAYLLDACCQIPITHLAGTIAARHTAVCKILGNMSGCAVPDQWEVDPDGPPPRNPSLWAIWNGIRLEKEAVIHFEDTTGKTVIDVGFCTHKSGVAGCSPDGLIADESCGFEGKAPLPTTHVDYILNPESLIRAYGDQCHFSMAVTGAKAWWLQSYCPGLPAARTLIQRDEYTERMVEGIEEFATALADARQEISALWDMGFKGVRP